jgi:hypothetical protein
MRETSHEAYAYLIATGRLAKLKEQVYKYLYEHGPASEKDAERFYEDRNDSIVPVFSKLEAAGLIRVVGEHRDVITGRRVLVWDVTSRVIPLKVDTTAKKTTYDQLMEKINQMRAEAYLFNHDQLEELFKIALRLEPKTRRNNEHANHTRI